LEGFADLKEGPKQLSVLLDDDTRASLGAYMERNEMTVSQATRILLALALREEGASGDDTFRRAAFREGLHLGMAKMKEKFLTSVQQAVTEALGDMDEA